MEKPHLEQTLINPTRKFSVPVFAYARAWDALTVWLCS